MAEFLETEAIDVDNIDDNDNNDEGENIATVSDHEFIDDSEQSESCYTFLTNVTRTYDDVMQDIENVDKAEARHYFDSEEEEELNEFSNFEAKVKLFRESLINPHGLEHLDSFFFSILYAIRHKLTGKVDFIGEEENLKEDVGLALCHDLCQIKSLLRLDGEDRLNFENQCFQVNRILSRHEMFLRVFELKDKFRYLIKQNSKQKKIFNEVSACVVERFNGFTIVRLEFDNEIRR